MKETLSTKLWHLQLQEYAEYFLSPEMKMGSQKIWISKPKGTEDMKISFSRAQGQPDIPNDIIKGG